jgi:hypothetical protein
VKKDEYTRWLPSVVFQNEQQKFKKKETELLGYLGDCQKGKLGSQPHTPRQD